MEYAKILKNFLQILDKCTPLKKNNLRESHVNLMTKELSKVITTRSKFMRSKFLK